MSKSSIIVNDELITKFITGDAEPEEALALTEWLKTPGNRRYFDQFESAWNRTMGREKVSFSREVAWKNFGHIREAQETVPPSRTVNIFWTPLRIAASVLIVVAGSFIIFFKYNDAPVEMQAVATAGGFRFLELSDRSTVTLHRNSRIRYPREFSDSRRALVLDRGEAFFVVAPDAKRPFVVTTPAAEIRVTGTEFDVSIADSVTSISVRDGKVVVSALHDTVQLTKGMTGSVRKHSHNISIDERPVINRYSYATHRLVFEETPLRDVIRDLENTYPYTIRLSNPNLEKCNLTATFYKDDIDKIVNLIAETLILTVQKNGRIFTLDGEGCP